MHIKGFLLNELNTITPFGEHEKKNIKMFKKSKKDLLVKELNYVEQIINGINNDKNDFYNNLEYSLYKVKEIRTTIKRLEENILDEIELFQLKNFVLASEEVKAKYIDLGLEIDYIKLKDLKEIISILDPEEYNLPTFYIYDAYSEKLKQIRKDKSCIEKLIFLENDKDKIKELKEQRLEIVVQEENEELEIKKELSHKLRKYISDINENIFSIGKLDLLISKARLALKYNAIKPEINNENRIYFKDLSNPQVNSILKEKNKSYTPITIDIKNKLTFITGANMGGKSVSMKTITLNLYLFQCGFFVFSKEANLPILDFIYLISDDMQNVNSGLSTFGAEILKLKEIINVMKLQDGFIALDEFARGTNPQEGRILIKSICDYFKSFNSITLISTHFDDVVNSGEDHYQVVGLKNANFEALKHKITLNKRKSVDILQDHMDYRLEKVNNDIEVPKDALNICSLLGLNEEVVDIARKYYNDNKCHINM